MTMAPRRTPGFSAWLGFDRDRAQQEGRQVRGVAVVHGLAHGLRGAARSRFFDARDRGRLLLRPALMLVPSALRRPRRLPWFVSWFVSWLVSWLVPWLVSWLVPCFVFWLVLWLGRRAGELVHEWNRLADQFFDRRDGFGVVRSGDDGDGGAVSPGAAGAADAVHVVVGMDRHVEIIDVADVGDIEAAGGDVGGDQERDFVLAELLERCGARRLVHVAVQRLHRKAVAQQRAMQRGDVAFAVAEDDAVLHAFGGADQAAQRVALLGAVAAGAGQELGRGGEGGGGF